MDANGVGEDADNPNNTGKEDATEDQLAKLEQSGSITMAPGASSARKDSLQRSIQMVIDGGRNSFVYSGPLGGEFTSNDWS